VSSYLHFICSQLKPLGFGFSLILFSSFGQTFMVSLYVPHLMRDLKLSEGSFGSLYSLATIISAVLLLRFGPRIDTSPLRPYTRKTILLLSASCLILGLAVHPVMAAVALLGLRFSGQGLLNHISQTVMGKHFEEDRGKALSLSSLGFSVGELIFPLLIIATIARFGWRVALGGSGVLVAAVMLSVIAGLPLEDFGKLPDPAKPTGAQSSAPKGPKEGAISLRTFIRQPSFWVFAPATFVPSFAVTGLFFYQLLLVENRGWNAEWYAMAFGSYALVRLASSLLGGPLVDRLSARALFPLNFIPLMAGTVLLGVSTSTLAAQIYLVLVGISLGVNGVVSGAILAETYGRDRLGSVRSILSAIGVAGAALAPVVFGLILEAGISFNILILGVAALLAATVANSFRLWQLPIRPVLDLQGH
jgi:MFS family permease